MMKKIEVMQTKNIQFKSMPSLTDYNKQRREQLNEFEKNAHLSGISCPECLKQNKEVELHQETDWVCLSNPPQVTVWCPECKFRGHRMA